VGEQNLLRDVLQAVISYEQGNWEEFSQLAKRLALEEEALGELYLQALRWSGELFMEEKDKPTEAPHS
jgi:c-di-GMP-related signal transduction protein